MSYLVDCCISLMSYSVDCRVSISFFGVRNHANGDSEAGGPRRKLLVIATLRLKGTAAMGGWYSTAGGGVVMCSTINQKVELCYFLFVVLQRRFESREQTSVVWWLSVEAAMMLMYCAVVCEFAGRLAGCGGCNGLCFLCVVGSIMVLTVVRLIHMCVVQRGTEITFK